MKLMLVLDKENIKPILLEKGYQFAESIDPENRDLPFNRNRVAMVYAIGAANGIYAFFKSLDIPTDFIDTKDFENECMKNGEAFADQMWAQLSYTKDIIPMAKEEIAHVYACGAKAVIWRYIDVIQSPEDKNFN
jgi:hypothetical protein